MDPQEAALSRSSEDSQLVGGCISYTQAQSLEYNRHNYTQLAAPGTTTDDSHLADDG